MPELQFKGKEFVYNHHLTVPYRPLVPDAGKSIGEPSLNGNLIIHGDNLHALKALLPMYAGKVDCIFIDPPYNTGNEGWSYNDNVNSPMMKEWLSSNPINAEDMLRHDKWCAMMWPRLQFLAELLSNAGTILVSIDDHEVHRLRALLDDAFGAEHFIGSFCWKTRNTDNRVKKKLSTDHEYVLVYSRGIGLKGRVIDRPDFSNPDDDSRGDYVTDPLTGKATAVQRPNLHYPMVNPDSGDIYPPDPARGWITDENGFNALLADKKIWWPANPSTGKPRKKRFLFETSERMPVSSFWADLKGQSGADEVDKILGKRLFDFPKSMEFMTRIIDLATGPNSLVLDSFAGTGTTGHAVLEINKRDGGSRRFVLVEGEDYADKVTAERIKRVIYGYEFQGSQNEELLRESITWTKLKSAARLLDEVSDIEQANDGRFDSISKVVQDGELIVTGEKLVTDRTDGLGGEFTYCTLGPELDVDKILTGETLPDYLAVGAWLFHTATGEAFDVTKVKAKNWYLGESSAYHVWLVYRPELDFLKSADSALTLSLAEKIKAAKPTRKKHLVFAPAKYVPNSKLLPMGIEYAPLPFALYRIERG
jgi:adenine-specific DNA-methyltransferase